MSSRATRVLLLLLLLVGAAGWWFLTPHERVYQGRQVSAWVRQLSITDFLQTNEVLDVLVDIGPDCLPALVDELRLRDNFLSTTWQKCWPKLPASLSRALPKPLSRAKRRATAAWALGQIGPAARSVTPSLVAALDDPDDSVRGEAVRALRFVGLKTPDVIAALARRLSDNDSSVQSSAAVGLWLMVPESHAAIPALIQLLRVPDRAWVGAMSLMEFGPLASNAVPDLIEVVNRGVAGHPADWKFPIVTGADGKPDGKDHSARHRAMAAEALGRIGIASGEVIKALQDALKYPPTIVGTTERTGPWVCENAAQALGLLGTNAVAAIPALAQALNETNAPALQQIALALGAMGVHARSSLPQLKNLFNELPEPFAARAGFGENPESELFWLRGAVARAIAQIGTEDTASLAVLIEHADSDSDAWQYLEGLGVRMKEFVPELTRKLASTNGQPQAATAELLWHIDPTNAAIVPALKQVVQHTNSATRAYAAYWHWKVTGDADAAIKVLVAEIEEPPSNAIQRFPSWLGQMGAAASPAVPALKKALWHHDTLARWTSGNALEKIDPTALELPPRRK